MERLERALVMSSITCSMCGSVLGEGPGVGSTTAFCGFCDMDVEPAVDGKRLNDEMAPVTHQHIHLKTPQLMEMHTKSLLEVLRLMREERGSLYQNMATLNRGARIDPGRFGEAAKECGQEYEVMTRKAFVVENILKKRLGYIPEKITDDLLIKYDRMCRSERNERPMAVGQQEKKREVQMPARSR